MQIIYLSLLKWMEWNTLGRYELVSGQVSSQLSCVLLTILSLLYSLTVLCTVLYSLLSKSYHIEFAIFLQYNNLGGCPGHSHSHSIYTNQNCAIFWRPLIGQWKQLATVINATISCNFVESMKHIPLSDLAPQSEENQIDGHNRGRSSNFIFTRIWN